MMSTATDERYRTGPIKREVRYRGLRFRPAIENTRQGALDVWDEDRQEWLATSLVNDLGLIKYYFEANGDNWSRSWDFYARSLKTGESVTIRFKK